MRVAGMLTTVVGLLAGILFFLLPTDAAALGATAGCGAPIINVFTDQPEGSSKVQQSLLKRCRELSKLQVAYGLAVGTLSAVGGLILLALGGLGRPHRLQQRADGGTAGDPSNATVRNRLGAG